MEAARRLDAIVSAIGEWKAQRLDRLRWLQSTCDEATLPSLQSVAAELERMQVVGACAVGCRDGQALVTPPYKPLLPSTAVSGDKVSTGEVSEWGTSAEAAAGPSSAAGTDLGLQWVAAAAAKLEGVLSASHQPKPAASHRVTVPFSPGIDTGGTSGRAVQCGQVRLRRLSMRSVGAWLAELAYTSIPTVGQHHPNAYLQLAETNFELLLRRPYVPWRQFEECVASVAHRSGTPFIEQATRYLHAAGVVVWYDTLARGRLRDIVFLQPAFLTQLLRVFVHSVEDDSDERAADDRSDDAEEVDAADRRGVSLAELARSGTQRSRDLFYAKMARKLRGLRLDVDTQALDAARWPPVLGWWPASAAVSPIRVTAEDAQGSCLTWRLDGVPLRDVLAALGCPTRLPGKMARLKAGVRRASVSASAASQLVRVLAKRPEHLDDGGKAALLRSLRCFEEFLEFASHNGWVRQGKPSDDAVRDDSDVTRHFRSARIPDASLADE